MGRAQSPGLCLQLLAYNHYERFSAAQALSDLWFEDGTSMSAPVVAASRKFKSSMDSAIDKVIDTKAFVNMRESLSEAELVSALEAEGDHPPVPPKDSTHTVAWWQARSVRACLGCVTSWLFPCSIEWRITMAQHGEQEPQHSMLPQMRSCLLENCPLALTSTPRPAQNSIPLPDTGPHSSHASCARQALPFACSATSFAFRWLPGPR